MRESACLAVALDAARAAAGVIRQHYRRDGAVRLKSDSTPVTDADVAAEMLIRERIRTACPDHG
ncbi:MAG: inositol monophosphatase family protein, partial [Planctomycetaceae bacterium]